MDTSETTRKKAKKFKGLKVGQVYGKVKGELKTTGREKSRQDNSQGALGNIELPKSALGEVSPR